MKLLGILSERFRPDYKGNLRAASRQAGTHKAADSTRAENCVS
jgi:hypothetical protein